MNPALINSICAAIAAAMALQSLFLGLMLIAQKSRRSHANLALAIASIAFALANTGTILRNWTGEFSASDIFWAAMKLPILFIPPFAYLHITGLTSGPSWRLSWGDIRHGLFCIAACILVSLAAALDSSPLARVVILGIYLVTILQGGYCLLAGLRLTRGGGSPQIAWLRFLLLSLTAFLVLFAVIHIGSLLLGSLPLTRLIVTSTAFLVTYAIGWASLTHGSAFSKPPEQTFRDLVAPLDKYRKSRQSAHEAKRILIKLDQILAAESLYRDAGLTLPILAAKVGAKPNLFSQALNQTLGMSFFDYVNDHRIAEAKRMLLSEENSILDIAYAVGFNSKSTFNAAFKKRTGQTPSLFRKSASL